MIIRDCLCGGRGCPLCITRDEVRRMHQDAVESLRRIDGIPPPQEFQSEVIQGGLQNETGSDGKTKGKQEECMLVCQRWEIMNSGRPPELNALCSLHISVEDRGRFVKLYNDNMPEEAPDTYFTPQRKSQDSSEREEPFECHVDPETFKRVRNSSCGVWAWANPRFGTVTNLLDQEQIISMDEVLNS